MRLTGLDGLRAISILMVIAYHLDEARFPHGEFGVNVFFVLSGFLITHLLGRFPYNILASFAMAAFSHHCIEQPALRIRDRVAGGSVSRSMRNKSMVAAAAGPE